MVIQDEPLDAVHAQTDGRVTLTDPCAPDDPTEAVTGAIVASQLTPTWFTVKVWPPTVTVPVRLARLGFAATEIDTVPSPVPVAPEVIVIQETVLVAFHVQPASVSTLMVLLVASAGTDALTGAIEYVQGTPACVTANVSPPMVIVPARDDVLVFAVML